MKIYLAHSTGYDYENELYKPLERIDAKYKIYFPHSSENDGQNSRGIITLSDIVLAEVSYPSTGQGIELGWAESNNIPIVCIHKSNAKPSSALSAVCKEFIEYSSGEDMVDKVEQILERKKAKFAY